MSSNDKHSKLLHLTAGGIGGCAGVLCTQPLDVIKTRLQGINKVKSVNVQGKFGTRTFSILRNIFAREGFHGLFRGVTPNLIAIFPTRAVYFGTYSTTKHFLERNFMQQSTFFVPLASAAAAGFVVYTASNPLWLVKTRIQLQEYGHKHKGSPNYKGYLDCMRRVYKEEGIRGFYKGLGASYFGIIEGGIYFVIYEELKNMRNKRNLHANPNARPMDFTGLEYLTMAAFSKFAASSMTYPHEVLRTRMREIVDGKSVYNGLIDAVKSIYRLEGLRGFYVGMGTHLMKTIPNTAIMFLSYEWIVQLVKRHNEKQVRMAQIKTQ